MHVLEVWLVLQLWCVGLAWSAYTVSQTIVPVEPTVNSAELIVVESSTNTVVTTFADSQNIYLRYNTTGFGISLYDLRACDNADCSSYNIQLLDQNGCPTVHAGVGTIITRGFVRDTVDSHIYETQSFQMFKWENGNRMFFKGKKSVCEAATPACNDMCSAIGRRRRSPVPEADIVTPQPPRNGTYQIRGTGGQTFNITFRDDGRNIALPDGKPVKGDKLPDTHSRLQSETLVEKAKGTGQFVYRLMKGNSIFAFVCDESTDRKTMSVTVLGFLSAVSTLVAVALTYKVQATKRRLAVQPYLLEQWSL